MFASKFQNLQVVELRILELQANFKNHVKTMGNSSYRLNFDLGKNNKIHHHS
jgi:hypothetical protein